ncbi:hypothetical protein, partial [Ornithinimicrobium sp. CNJ-824]|uniref:hypothetical protein n=1 Tax=Ornithinimicrobium sp. CNJ-824 TaxID=1904966 RepID=UPI001EDA4108
METSDTLFTLEPAKVAEWGVCAVTFEVIADLPLPTEHRTACWSCSALGELLELEEAVPSAGLWEHAQRKSKQYVLRENGGDALRG